jgi:O-acetyl-ADP-ribose deacetylase (regulator of RNase III)
MQIIKGDLVALAREGNFDVIAHGCNCFCNMGAGLAVPMAKTFGCDKFRLEAPEFKGHKGKLGQIDYKEFEVSTMSVLPKGYEGICTQELRWPLIVVNCYTQYFYGKGRGGIPPIDYDALRSCMKYLALFEGKRIGLPKIGCGLAGGNWDIVSKIIEEELANCQVTIVEFEK